MPNDIVLILSDGFWEAKHRIFGQPLYSLIRLQQLKIPLEEGLDGIIRFFRENFETPTDDATILSLQWRGPVTPP